MLGETIMTQLLSNSITHIDLNQFVKGMYLITVHSGDETVSKKFFIR